MTAHLSSLAQHIAAMLLLLTAIAAYADDQVCQVAGRPQSPASPVLWNERELAAAKESYLQRCAVCHLPSGEGVPGAFPPLVNRIAAIASEAEGRRYLVAVVTTGLTGAITVDGTQYAGFMQGFASSMDNAQVAEVLSYLALELDATGPVDFQRFTREEVEALRRSLASSSAELRKKVAVLNRRAARC